MPEIGDDPRAQIEFEKLRFEFAWRHFEFHARQRTTMFHFFILLVPFLFGGFFYVLKGVNGPSPRAAILIAITGFVLSITFGLLDWRNRDLYRISQRNLRLIEKNFLYAPGCRDLIDEDDKQPPFRGVITEEKAFSSNRTLKNMVVRHAFLMTFVHAICTGLFALLAIYVAVRFNVTVW
jgi:hypothetical protein